MMQTRHELLTTARARIRAAVGAGATLEEIATRAGVRTRDVAAVMGDSARNHGGGRITNTKLGKLADE